MELRRRRRSAPRGAAAVEFAIVLPLLLLFVLGSIDWGYYFFVEQVVVNASREGARAGSLAAPDDPTAQANALAAAKNYLQQGGIPPASATVTTTVTASSMRVAIQVPVGSITGFLPALLPPKAGASSEMRR